MAASVIVDIDLLILERSGELVVVACMGSTEGSVEISDIELVMAVVVTLAYVHSGIERPSR
jgi:hypothetical protein